MTSTNFVQLLSCMSSFATRNKINQLKILLSLIAMFCVGLDYLYSQTDLCPQIFLMRLQQVETIYLRHFGQNSRPAKRDTHPCQTNMDIARISNASIVKCECSNCFSRFSQVVIIWSRSFSMFVIGTPNLGGLPRSIQNKYFYTM